MTPNNVLRHDIWTIQEKEHVLVANYFVALPKPPKMVAEFFMYVVRCWLVWLFVCWLVVCSLCHTVFCSSFGVHSDCLFVCLCWISSGVAWWCCGFGVPFSAPRVIWKIFTCWCFLPASVLVSPFCVASVVLARPGTHPAGFVFDSSSSCASCVHVWRDCHIG